MFHTVLIANRGEIAVRVAKSVRKAGGRAVAIFSDPDRDAPHVAACDSSVGIGGSTAAESYLDIGKVIAAATSVGAEAIHPGYGFLSENAGFAEACAAAGIIFIGPRPDAIELMGNKRAAKTAVMQADVPCIPGYQGADQSDDKFIAEASRIGFPVMVKAAAGGGGRGMRIVTDAAGMEEALMSARSEARNAFGNDELILEKAISDGRHIEIQVAADAHGNVVYLGERDCSLQRRHQKVIEEAPSPFVDETLRASMGVAAANAARSCNYLGVGTVEFLVAQDRTFCFLEMNTRLQVEHPVTEMITGVDLVDWQLRIAGGEPLPLSQDEITLTGHAIEARIYAEDPTQNFMPQSGRIVDWQPAQGTGIRVDAGVRAGQDVSPFYDPMLAKVVAWGQDRGEARRRLKRALEDTRLLGLVTNQAFLGQLLTDPVFVNGEATTNYIDQAGIAGEALPVIASEVALATVLLMRELDPQTDAFQNWSNAAPMLRHKTIAVNDEPRTVAFLASGTRYDVTVDDETMAIEVVHSDGRTLEVVLDGTRRSFPYAFDGEKAYVQFADRQVVAEDASYWPALSANAASSGQINASTEGQVVHVAVSKGDRVEEGQLLVVVEAMKMEHRHLADGHGVVSSVFVSESTQIKKGQPLVELALDSEVEGSHS